MHDETDYCPVCGYNLGFPAWKGESPSDEICPSCGIQFGYDDAAGGSISKRVEVYKNWRGEWIKRGMKWWSIENPLQPEPMDWNPKKQMEDIPEEF